MPPRDRSTAELVRASDLKHRFKPHVPASLLRLRTLTPGKYWRSRDLNRRYRAYYEEARHAWQPSAIHDAPSARSAAQELDQLGVSKLSLAHHAAALDSARALLEDAQNLVCVRDHHWYFPASLDAVRTDPPDSTYVRWELLVARHDLAAALTEPALVAPIERLWGCNARLVVADVIRSYQRPAEAFGTMGWHIDNQPPHCVKLIVYLEDVGEGAGELCYVPGSHREAAVRPGFGGINTVDLARLRGREVRRCTGAAYEAWCFDTNGYHCGGRVQSGLRTSVVAAYRPSKLPASEHVARYGFAGYPHGEPYGPRPDTPWWNRPGA